MTEFPTWPSRAGLAYVLSDATRTAVVKELGGRALTVREIAARIAKPDKNVAYHVHQLARLGVIRSTQTHMRGSAVASAYQVSDWGILELIDEIDDFLSTELTSIPPCAHAVSRSKYEQALLELLGDGHQLKTRDAAHQLGITVAQLRRTVQRLIERGELRPGLAAASTSATLSGVREALGSL